jgi:assimilatory nitrate reductase catalytic subunit
VETDWTGFLVVAGAVAARPDCLWATRIAVPKGEWWELAGSGDPRCIEALLPRGEPVQAEDRARGTRRQVVLAGGRMVGALFTTRTGTLPSRDWLIAQLGAEQPVPALLAGRAPGAQAERGPIICACNDVGLNTIRAAISAQRLCDVAAIGQAVGAGTGCGSCRPALAGLLAESEGTVRAS